MNEMIERAARAIAIRRGIHPDQELTYGGGKVAWKYFTDDAGAVIEAMREPTDKMINLEELPYSPGEMKAYWQAMIDVSLK